MRAPGRSLAALALVAWMLLAAPAMADTGQIGAAAGITNNGRHLQPFAQQLVTLGNFPVGGAVTPDGRWYWTVDAGRGANDVKVVSVATGRVVQTLTVPGASGGIVMDPRRALAYVSGVAGSTDRGEALPPGTPGLQGDVVHVFRYDAASGLGAEDHAIAVPPPSSAAAPQNFPPTNTTRISWPDRLSISPDGGTLLVPLNLAGGADVVDLRSGSVRYAATGEFPYGSAVLPDGRTGLVSNETPGTVSVIDLASATKRADIQVGPALSHPEAITVAGRRAYVALANTDQVAVIDTSTLAVTRTLSVARPQGLGSAPVALATTPDASQLLVAEAGADTIAAFRTADGSEVGRIPTGQYPSDVQTVPSGRDPCGVSAAVAPVRRPARRRHRRHHRPSRSRRTRGARRTVADAARARTRRRALRHRRTHRRRGANASHSCAKLLYISAKGLGTGPNPAGPQPTSPNDTDDAINATQYLPLLNIGSAAIANLPSAGQITGLTTLADQQLLPSDPQPAPADTPLRPDGPIKHVFYIVRENRTYDQVLGDDGRGAGDPGLTLFGSQVTPNAHALVNRFPLLDHYYANSEASIDGHFWTSSASVSDYVNKNWFQNYRAGSGNSHGRPYDFTYAVTWPSTGSLFDRALGQGISFFNYGEGIGDVLPLPDRDRDSAASARVAQVFSHSDVGQNGCYPNDASIGKDAITGQTVFDSVPPAGAPPGSLSRAQCFQGRFASQGLTNAVPTFNYLVLSNDHTRVLDPASYTPGAMVADNDLGLGQIVDTITHSPIWSSSAIFVTEDDSQDGADHVDAHRTVGMVISPFTRPGAVVHRRYDMLSMIRSMELIMGMQPLGLFDSLAVPMYDAFAPTPDNAGPYTQLPATTNLLAKNPPAASAAQARAYRFRGLDQISQRYEDRLLWRSVHGAASPPPPPGPNAVQEPRAGRGASFNGPGG